MEKQDFIVDNLEALDEKLYKESLERSFFEMINRFSDKDAYKALHFTNFQELKE